MRSEHKTTADEWDAFTGWRHLLAYLQRPGARKRIKARLHRIDRRQARQRLTERSDQP